MLTGVQNSGFKTIVMINLYKFGQVREDFFL